MNINRRPTPLTRKQATRPYTLHFSCLFAVYSIQPLVFVEPRASFTYFFFQSKFVYPELLPLVFVCSFPVSFLPVSCVLCLQDFIN
ncbi:hypothetical protein QBC45DRAFT_400264 [Copromyces sp. CBS 386.78]|nr:hypothetical protein QBC45DRAFT_400264 [Copromyces sp. CBS 386.78]